MADLPTQSKCYKRRLHRKVEKERLKKIRHSEINRIVTEVQKSFEVEESSDEFDENLNESLGELSESQELSNIEENSDFESSSVDVNINSNEDSVANYKAVQKHMDIPSQTGSNSKFTNTSPQFCDIDDSQNTFSTTSTRDNTMQDFKFLLLKMDRKIDEINYKFDTVIMNQGKLNRSLLPQEKKRQKPHNMPSLPLKYLKFLLLKMDRKIDEINFKVDSVIMNQGKLNRSLLPQEKKRQKPHNMPSLPLKNENDIQAMEKWLLSDAENKIALCDYLTSFGSNSDEKKAATTIMQKILYNSLAKKYNFDGHGEKTGFKTLNLWIVIEGTLAIKFPDSELKTALKTIKSWLRNASGRKQEESNVYDDNN